jgi:hypothetical protein
MPGGFFFGDFAPLAESSAGRPALATIRKFRM